MMMENLEEEEKAMVRSAPDGSDKYNHGYHKIIAFTKSLGKVDKKNILLGSGQQS